MTPSLRMSPLHSRCPRVPLVLPLISPREMMVPPLVMARVMSSALAPCAPRMAREPMSRYEVGEAMTTLENRATEFFPLRLAVGYICTFFTGCMQM